MLCQCVITIVIIEQSRAYLLELEGRGERGGGPIETDDRYERRQTPRRMLEFWLFLRKSQDIYREVYIHTHTLF